MVIYEKLKNILLDIYKEFPSNSRDSLEEYYKDVDRIKDDLCSRVRELLSLYNLPLNTIKEDLIPSDISHRSRILLDIPNEDNRTELIKLLEEKEYVLSIQKHLRDLLRSKITSEELLNFL